MGTDAQRAQRADPPPLPGRPRPVVRVRSWTALCPESRPVRLVGVPRSAPPISRARPGIGGIVSMNARPPAVAALVQHAAARGLQAEREDVARVLGWIVGHDRGVAPVAGRGTFAVEWSVPGVTEADGALGLADVDSVTDHLLAQDPAASALSRCA